MAISPTTTIRHVRRPGHLALAAGGLALTSLATGFLATELSPSQVAVACAFALTYVGGLPALLLLLFVPLRTAVPFLDSLSWVDTAVIGFVARELTLTQTKAKRFSPLLIAFLGFAAVSALYSVDRQASLRSLLLLGEGLSLIWATKSSMLRSHANPRTLMRGWLLLGLASSIAAFALFASSPDVWWNLQRRESPDAFLSQSLRLGSPFWGPSNYYASILLLFLPLSILAFARRTDRLLAFFALTVMAPALFLTTSRGAALALGLVAVGYLMRLAVNRTSRNPTGGRLGWEGAALWVLAVGGLILFGRDLMEYFFTSRRLMVGAVYESTRVDLVAQAVSYITANPLLGYGYGTAPSLTPAFKGGVHNYPLQLAIEVGVIGAGLGLLLYGRLLLVLQSALRAPQGGDRVDVTLLQASYISLLLVAVNILVEASFEGVVFFLMLTIVIGIATGALARVVAVDALSSPDGKQPTSGPSLKVGPETRS